MDGAGTRVVADKMALEKVAKLLIAPNKQLKNTGRVWLVQGAQHGTAAVSPATHALT